MTHETMVATVGSVHAATALVVLAAFYRYGDRSETFSRSLQGAESLLTKLRRKLSSDLADHLTPLVTSIQQKAVASPILDPHGEGYSEKPPALVESEEFRESVQKFIEGDGYVIVDYRSALIARQSWCFWAKALSWCLFTTLAWLVLVAGMVFLLEKLFQIGVPDVILTSSCIITLIGILSCLVPLPFQLRSHDKLCHLRMQHDSP